MSAPCREEATDGRRKRERPLLIFSTAKLQLSRTFLVFSRRFRFISAQLSCLFILLTFFFFFARLDQRFPPDGPRSNLVLLFSLLLPSSSLYSAPCGWLGNGKCWAPLYNYNQGAREHTHTHMPLFTVGASSIAEEEEVDGCAPPFSLPLFFLPQKLRQFSWGFVLEKKRAASFSLLFLFLYNISFLF